MKQARASDEEIDQAFHTPYQMDIFAYVRETKREQPQRHSHSARLQISDHDAV